LEDSGTVRDAAIRMARRVTLEEAVRHVELLVNWMEPKLQEVRGENGRGRF
jgi:hypothetical protein